MADETIQVDATFAVLFKHTSGAVGADTKLSFQRLLEEYVLPYEQGKKFFVDGIPFKNSSEVERLKIVQETRPLLSELDRLRMRLNKGRLPSSEFDGARLACLSANGVDVTNRITQVYEDTIASKAKKWVTERPQLLAAAAEAFLRYGSL